MALVGVGKALLLQHAADKALPALERALKLTKAVSPPGIAHAELALAHALVDSHGDAARAERLSRSAVTRLAPFGGAPAREAADASKWLEANLPGHAR